MHTFPGFIMTHVLEGLSSSPLRVSRRFQRGSFAILARDLPAFCDGLARAEAYMPTKLSTKNHLTIHDPFRKTSSPDFMCCKNQDRLLLDPYRAHLRSFPLWLYRITGYNGDEITEANTIGISRLTTDLGNGDERHWDMVVACEKWMDEMSPGVGRDAQRREFRGHTALIDPSLHAVSRT